MMKNSNVEWIGQIPDDWQMIKIKNIANIINGYSFKSELYTEQGIKVVRITNVSDGYLNNDNPRYYPSEYKDDIKDAMLQPKDILITLTGYIGLSGIVNDDYLPAGLNQRVGCIRINKNGYDNRFLHYVISTNQFIEMSNLYSSGTAQQNLSTEWLKNQLVPDIDIKEQIKIADLLDKKCGQIDRLIKIQQQEIEKLKEYKTSVITQTVTKGLDPNVPMKDSGIEWIGQIPAHWNLNKLKFVSYLITDGTHQTPNYIDNGIPFLSIKDISSGKIDFSDVKYISELEHSELYKHAPINKGDMLFTRIGTMGVFVLVDTDKTFDIFVSVGLIKFKKYITLILKKYLMYFFSSLNFLDFINLVKAGGGTTAAKFNLEDVRNSIFTSPPEKEMESIVQYIDDCNQRIVEVITKKQKKIQKLQEYKKSLIYEYVTGKRRVI